MCLLAWDDFFTFCFHRTANYPRDRTHLKKEKTLSQLISCWVIRVIKGSRTATRIKSDKPRCTTLLPLQFLSSWCHWQIILIMCNILWQQKAVISRWMHSMCVEIFLTRNEAPSSAIKSTLSTFQSIYLPWVMESWLLIMQSVAKGKYIEFEIDFLRLTFCSPFDMIHMISLW